MGRTNLKELQEEICVNATNALSDSVIEAVSKYCEAMDEGRIEDQTRHDNFYMVMTRILGEVASSHIDEKSKNCFVYVISEDIRRIIEKIQKI